MREDLDYMPGLFDPCASEHLARWPAGITRPRQSLVSRRLAAPTPARVLWASTPRRAATEVGA